MKTTKLDYLRYLRSEHWRLLRTAAVRRDGKCVNCGSVVGLEVHHVVYRLSWYETVLGDLETLCSICHERHHRPSSPPTCAAQVTGSIGSRRWNVLGQRVTRRGRRIRFRRRKNS